MWEIVMGVSCVGVVIKLDMSCHRLPSAERRWMLWITSLLGISTYTFVLIGGI
ncbi:hypothetical protein AHAS_Ahas11G0246200 [Arachis hypogaea]